MSFFRRNLRFVIELQLVSEHNERNRTSTPPPQRGSALRHGYRVRRTITSIPPSRRVQPSAPREPAPQEPQAARLRQPHPLGESQRPHQAQRTGPLPKQPALSPGVDAMASRHLCAFSQAAIKRSRREAGYRAPQQEWSPPAVPQKPRRQCSRPQTQTDLPSHRRFLHRAQSLDI